ncbi:MAG: alpha/beta fold hydrolase [Candidatus Sericytochromatia bacterium]|nr:alpha/beta fold hydrolase [Candidatus Sericytochromatia bacterium]
MQALFPDLSSRPLAIPGEPILSAAYHRPKGEGPFPGVVLVHGLLSAKEEYADLGNALARRGIAALSFDFRGHGASAGVRSLVVGDQQLDDLDRAIGLLETQGEVDVRRLMLIGHSLGTVSVLRLLAAHPDRFAGAVLLAPPSVPARTQTAPMRAAYRAAYQAAKLVYDWSGQHVHVPYPYTYRDLFTDPSARRRAEALGFLQRSLSLMGYPYLFEEIDNPAVARQVRTPVLVVAASEDKVISNAHSREVYEALGSADKEWVRVVGAGHSMMADRGHEELTGLLVAWAAERLGLGGSGEGTPA